MKRLVVLFMLGAAFHAYAQTPDVEARENRVEVKNYRDPELRSYAQMLRGMKAYRDKHQLAPSSKLYFLLVPKSRNVMINDVTMRLASDAESIDIPIDAAGKFQLPFIDMKKDDEYDLILNRPKGEFMIRPYVASEGLPSDTERLGDLRLECQVRWGVEQQDVSPVFRTYVNLLSSGNPCTSRFVKVGFYAPVGIDTITLNSPASPVVDKVHPFETYSLPIWDEKLSDDLLVTFARSVPTATQQAVQPPKF